MSYVHMCELSGLQCQKDFLINNLHSYITIFRFLNSSEHFLTTMIRDTANDTANEIKFIFWEYLFLEITHRKILRNSFPKLSYFSSNKRILYMLQ